MTTNRCRPEGHNTSDGSVRVQLFPDLWPGRSVCDDETCDADPIPLTSPPSRRKKLTLTPELRQLPAGFIKRGYSSGGSASFVNSNGFGYLYQENGTKLQAATTLQETMELISESISMDRNSFSDFANDLKCQVVQLEEEIYRKTAKIENLQLYNSEKLKIINSLITALNETQWKRDTMLRMCQEHAPNKLYKSMVLVNRVSDKMPAFHSNLETLRSYANSLDANDTALCQVIGQLVSGLDECIGVINKAASKEPSDTLLDETNFNSTIKNIIYGLRNFPSSAVETDGPQKSSVAFIDRTSTNNEERNKNLKNLIELWEVVKNLSQSNQYLANRVASMNIHKTSLQYQLNEMENSTKELELKTITEIEQVEKKQEILNRNESMIQQRWDELNTSQEIVIQTHRAQEIDQEVEDLQIEYDNHDKENRQLKTDLNYLRNELNEYRMKCERLEKETKRIETEKNNVLEEYAKSWGHHNSKQKIKYTGRLIKDIDCITQEIKWLETEIQAEIEKQDHGVVNVNTSGTGSRTPVFSKIQPKSEKIPQTPKTCGIVESNKRQNLGMFRESVVSKLHYQ
ncbi:Hypothetical protein CINCED_3A002352 [Cinara cedri]|uniref:Uncharacterized protein n=1 Tax=Cinara cedri TaxID=506608 RepID=A0A5E4NLB5_9HEMI|nr:Hypothetical protein CINCED_3A002352 [Cinara cedri]